MAGFEHAINRLLQLLIQAGNLIVSALVTIEVWLRGQLAQLGLGPAAQTAIMVVVAALLILGTLRLFGGLIRVAVVLILILISIHIMLPVLPQ